LSVSQHVIETEYYLVDLPLLLRYKAAVRAEERLMSLSIATISQSADKDVRERFVIGLQAEMDIYGSSEAPKEPGLDRSGLAELRNKLGRR
jgi:hypothetical protein